MWKYSLEGIARSDSSELSAPAEAGRRHPHLQRYLVDAALLLGFLLTSSWLICR
jgi:hypothetical protein